jgi:hypothetical protein
VKSLFSEHWDDYQLAAVSFGVGGNRIFFDLCKDYHLEKLDKKPRYSHKAVKYHLKRLNACLDGRPFSDLPPAKDWKETFERT